MVSMIELDGAQGEGGGQVLRTALSLSVITGKPFQIHHIRAGREKPGLLRQHLTAVQAAARVGAAHVEGATVGSTQLSFVPSGLHPGVYAFSVGTAGSAMLVLQTVLPPLMLASGPSSLTFEGGTHNPAAPPFEFLQKSFLPVVRRMGPTVEVKLERAGFFPAGGGRFQVQISPVEKLSPVELLERGPQLRRRARALLAHLERDIAVRELAEVRERLGWAAEECVIESIASIGPGNVLLLELEYETGVEVIAGFGMRGIRAEELARRACREARDFIKSSAPVGIHLADQLLLPLALAGGGSFRTSALTTHTTTNIQIIQQFLPVEISAEAVADGSVKVTVRT